MDAKFGKAAKTFSINTVVGVVILIILGIAVFSIGLNNPFERDDFGQIINNPVIQSFSNVGSIFDGSTFYGGPGINHLIGAYYRPLMSVAFTGIYSLFGANPVAFHSVQLLLHIACSVLIFFVFRYFFRSHISLTLAAIFLVHPINSQNVFAIPSLQEPLFLFFGMLALLLLIKFQERSIWHLAGVACFLFLSLLSKESGILFVGVALLYAGLAGNKRRFLVLLGLCLISVVVYSIIKVHAVGFFVNPDSAPIDRMGLGARFLSIPSIVLFYFTKFFIPVGLASGYYWAYNSASIMHFWIPLALDLFIACGIVYLANRLRSSRINKRFPALFAFFAVWLLIGLLPHLQLLPLDMTASETWFYFPIVGLLGMAGVLLEAYPSLTSSKFFLAAATALVLILSIRTTIRAHDWRSAYELSIADLKVSKEHYIAEDSVAVYLASMGRSDNAKSHINHSLSIFPDFIAYKVLSAIDARAGDYAAADQALDKALRQGDHFDIYENKAALTVVYGNSDVNSKFLREAVRKFPKDSQVWFYLALQQYRDKDTEDAKASINEAAKWGSTPSIDKALEAITNNIDISISYTPPSL